MITIQNEKIAKMPLTKAVLSAICKVGENDITDIAESFDMTEDELIRYLEKKLLIDGMSIEIAVWAINFIPDVLNDNREHGLNTSIEFVVHDAIVSAGVYVTNCKPKADIVNP